MPNLRPGIRGRAPPGGLGVPPPPWYPSPPGAEESSADSHGGDGGGDAALDVATIAPGLVALPILVAILVACALRECYLARRRNDWAAALQGEATAKARTAREEEIAAALVVRTAGECRCPTAQIRVTDDASIASSSDASAHLSSVGHNDHSDNGGGDSDDDNDDGGDGGNHKNSRTLSTQTCAICLEPYVVDQDRVAWSRFQTCRHAFHHQCIATWLAETGKQGGRCPCCRGPYLREGRGEGNRGEENAGAFTAFCVMHGLTSEKDCQTGGPSVPSVEAREDLRTALEEPLLSSCHSW